MPCTVWPVSGNVRLPLPGIVIWGAGRAAGAAAAGPEAGGPSSRSVRARIATGRATNARVAVRMRIGFYLLLDEGRPHPRPGSAGRPGNTPSPQFTAPWRRAHRVNVLFFRRAGDEVVL